MKEKIKKFWWIIALILIILSFIGGAVFWFLLFPTGEIKKVCEETAMEKAKEVYKQKIELSGDYEEGKDVEEDLFSKDDYDFYYEECLEEHLLFE